MRQTNFLVLCMMSSLAVTSCIKPFEPDIRSNDARKYVITGQVTDGDGNQTVNISMTSPIGDPQYIPAPDCFVRISDDNGNNFFMNSVGNGDYTTFIDPAYIIPGASFKIDVSTPEGEEMSSDFDQIPECPDVDSVYYVRKNMEGTLPGHITKGIQLYVDLNATGVNSHYFRWEAIETWEYQTDYPMEWYYDGHFERLEHPDYSRKICWSTANVPGIYTISTDNLSANMYPMVPLNFVDNRTTKLMYGYSLLIKQYALSEDAYSYWEQLRINSNQQGGLYAKQPLAIKGNMHNTTDPKKSVLGFFGASAMKTKRVFIHDVPDLPLYFSTFCYADTLKEGFSDYDPSSYPIYLKVTDTYTLILNEECVNCLKLGGTNVKPDFWPN